MTSYDRDPDMPSFGKMVWWGICLFVVVSLLSLGGTWLAQGNNFFLYKVFAPQQEKVRREVYENTPSYVQGMVQDLQDLQRDYMKADAAHDEEHKKALASMILHRSASFPEDQIPPDLRAFIWGLKKDAGLAR